MADFNVSYKITAAFEGGYVFDSEDKGLETFKGISRVFEPSWKGWTIVDKLKKEQGFPDNLKSNALLQRLVSALYKANYWNVLNLDEITDQRMANELMDTATNQGVGRAALFFQRVLNAANRDSKYYTDLKLDAQVGMKTIAAFESLNDKDKFMVWKLFNCLQGAKYIDICEANPTQKKFLRGWAERVF